MTTRSTRIAAEQKIIDAAYRWYNHYVNLTNPEVREGYGQSVLDLRDAVKEHVAIGLDATHQPAVSHNTTDTSTEAAASMADHVGKQARECFDEIVVVYMGGGLGLTVDQLEQVLKKAHQSVSARVNELRDKGWLVDSGAQRPTRSGRKAIVWRPTTAALQHVGLS